jgi:uncharacterized membrane protein
MGAKPEGLTLERVDNDKGYSPENCRWATTIEQGRNQRQTKLDLQKVREIRELYARGDITQKELGKKYEVTHTLIGYVVRNKRWQA